MAILTVPSSSSTSSVVLSTSRFTAPADSDSENSDAEATSQPAWQLALPPTFASPGLSSFTHKWQPGVLEAQLQTCVAALQQVALFQQALQEIDEDEAVHLAEALSTLQSQQAALAGQEAARQAHAAAGHSQATQRLQRAHEDKAAAMSRQVAAAADQAAAQRSREQAAETARRQTSKAAEERRAAAAAEAAQRGAAEARQVAERQQQPQQPAEVQQPVLQERAQAQAPRAPASSVPRAAPDISWRIASQAARHEAACQAHLAKLQAQAQALAERTKERRALDKALTLQVTQISATQDQVRAKGQALVRLLQQGDAALQAHAMLSLASRLAGQCEAQVALTHSFSFPLAEVATTVCAQHPDFALCLLGKLQQASPLLVPKCAVLRKGAATAAYLKAMGYREAPSGPQGPAWESTDAVAGRLQGLCWFLGALLQNERAPAASGLAAAWQLLARFLNALPANRLTATALDALLRAAGFRLHQVYRSALPCSSQLADTDPLGTFLECRRQFVKLLTHIVDVFLPALSEQGDADARAVHARLHVYITAQEYLPEPEGRALPASDSSTYDRA